MQASHLMARRCQEQMKIRRNQCEGTDVRSWVFSYLQRGTDWHRRLGTLLRRSLAASQTSATVVQLQPHDHPEAPKPVAHNGIIAVISQWLTNHIEKEFIRLAAL